MAKRHERTRARRSALALLYTSEITDEGATKIAEEGRFLAEDGPLPEYAAALVRGVEAHRTAIDRHLAATSENWSLMRMPIVDRSILRLAAYEMMYVDDVPTSVTINEAVELAKDYGGEDESPRFVNGILGRIAKILEEEKAGALSPAAAPVAEAVEPEAAEPAATPVAEPSVAEVAKPVEAAPDAPAAEEIAAAASAEASKEA
ncbi:MULTISPECIES: transcription antitermination factor NusB [Gordonibacter]|uniref:Transcription antitermination protein NusB n=1 Tax=Gordonibacter faecis TaxID=3047475 RepID=A0ABT7DJB8_9ACTN|nr:MULTISPECIES: transcription antitermination factor NusB [unclassified Gordonibacter]MDJ1649613.1 transcription antitermination factor NusB [Gordonibacter sp. KGMB12511]